MTLLQPIHGTVRWHTVVGYALITAAVLVSGYWPTPDPGFDYPLLWMAAIAAFAAAVALAVLPAITRSPLPFAVIVALAGVLVGLAVIATGGLNSHVLPISTAVAVAGAALLPAHGAFIVVAASTLTAAVPLLGAAGMHQARESLVLTASIPVVGSFVHAMKNLTVREGTERRYLHSLMQASRLSTTLDLSEALVAAVDGIKQALVAHHAVLYLLEPKESVLVPEVIRISPEAVAPNEAAAIRSVCPRIGEGLAGWVAQTRQPLLSGDAQADPRNLRLPDIPRRAISMILVPLQVGERLIGVLRVSRLGRDQFSHHDVQITALFANQAAIAIENARLYAEARRLAITDGLTGLYNGRHLHERLQAELARARRHGRPLALAMIDSDSLKSVNDRFGHAEGDRLVVHIADCIRAHARESDVIFRYAGDEFILLLPETDAVGAHVLVERIRQAAEQSEFKVGTESVRCTISAGVAAFPVHGETAELLLRTADAAMYRAKQQGKNLVVVAPRVA